MSKKEKCDLVKTKADILIKNEKPQIDALVANATALAIELDKALKAAENVQVDIDTGDIVTGAHRHDACSYLGIVGYMFVLVRCSSEWTRKRFGQ